MARQSTQRNPSVVGKSREGMIAAMVQSSFSNDEIMAALEKRFPEYIAADDPRRDPKVKAVYIADLPAFDAKARQRAQEAIRSTRKQDMDKEKDIDGDLAVIGAGQGAMSVDEYDFANLSRFECGVPSLDYIYGQTKFVHVEDHPDSKYETRDSFDFKTRETVRKKFWVKGTWQRGDPMIPDHANGGWVRTREKDGTLRAELDLGSQKIEHGIPESFLSIWAGSPGVGKSRTAIKLGNAVCGMERLRGLPLPKMQPVLYLNGEELNLSKFRQMCGNVDPELFIANTAPMLRLDTVIQDIYTYKPRLVVVDSLQMIAEWKKGRVAQDNVLARLNLLKTEEAAGKPHIVFISQLNKQEEMAGRRELEHMVDFVARVTRYEGRKGTFLFECPRKNRGGETPRGAIYRHTETSIECLSTDVRQGANFYKLVQPTTPVLPIPALNANAAPQRVDHMGAIV